MPRHPLGFAAALVIGAGLALLATGCQGSENATVQPSFAADAFETVMVSSVDSIGLGEQRLIVLLRNGPIRVGGPEQRGRLELKRLGADPVQIDAEWVWGDSQREQGGAWVAWNDFDQAGTWRATMTVDGQTGTATTFSVLPNTPMPRAGERAPSTVTETLASATLASLSTDDEPDRRLYQTSLDEALTSGAPTAVVFSTPEFCTTDVCGPLLDEIKSRIDQFPGIDFIHVEVYEDINEHDGELIPRGAVLEWGIATEPWVFLVDADGVVDATYEGLMSRAELDTGLAALSS